MSVLFSSIVNHKVNPMFALCHAAMTFDAFDGSVTHLLVEGVMMSNLAQLCNMMPPTMLTATSDMAIFTSNKEAPTNAKKCFTNLLLATLCKLAALCLNNSTW